MAILHFQIKKKKKVKKIKNTKIYGIPVYSLMSLILPQNPETLKHRISQAPENPELELFSTFFSSSNLRLYKVQFGPPIIIMVISLYLLWASS